MITLEVHREISAGEILQRPELTCYEGHRSFHAKSEDQLCLERCDQCFDNLDLRESIISVHVKARPPQSAAL